MAERFSGALRSAGARMRNIITPSISTRVVTLMEIRNDSSTALVTMGRKPVASAGGRL